MVKDDYKNKLSSQEVQIVRARHACRCPGVTSENVSSVLLCSPTCFYYSYKKERESKLHIAYQYTFMIIIFGLVNKLNEHWIWGFMKCENFMDCSCFCCTITPLFFLDFTSATHTASIWQPLCVILMKRFKKLPSFRMQTPLSEQEESIGVSEHL